MIFHSARLPFPNCYWNRTVLRDAEKGELEKLFSLITGIRLLEINHALHKTFHLGIPILQSTLLISCVLETIGQEALEGGAPALWSPASWGTQGILLKGADE